MAPERKKKSLFQENKERLRPASDCIALLSEFHARNRALLFLSQDRKDSPSTYRASPSISAMQRHRALASETLSPAQARKPPDSPQKWRSGFLRLSRASVSKKLRTLCLLHGEMLLVLLKGQKIFWKQLSEPFELGPAVFWRVERREPQTETCVSARSRDLVDPVFAGGRPSLDRTNCRCEKKILLSR